MGTKMTKRRSVFTPSLLFTPLVPEANHSLALLIPKIAKTCLLSLAFFPNPHSWWGRSSPDILLMGSCYSFTLLPLHLPSTSSPNVTSQVDARVWCPFPTWLVLLPHNDRMGLQSRDAALECPPLHIWFYSLCPLGSFLPAFQNPFS